MGKISFFPKNMDIHETLSLSLHPNISRGGMHDKDLLRAYVIERFSLDCRKGLVLVLVLLRPLVG